MGKIALRYLSLVLFLTSCQKEDFGPQKTQGGEVEPDSAAVLIVNEGNFQWGNASVGQYNPDNYRYQEGLYREANGRPIGDVLQSVHRVGDRYYALLNGSNLLRICQTNWEEIKGISLLGAPRKLETGFNSLWISDWYANELLQLSLAGDEIKRINLNKPPSGLISWQDHLLIAEKRVLKSLDPLTYQIDTVARFRSDLLEYESLEAGLVLSLANGKLLILRSLAGTPELIDQYQFRSLGLSGNDRSDFYSFRKDSIYYHPAGEGYRAQFLQAAECESFYNMDFQAGYIYLFDALDYVKASRIRQYRASDGALLNDFEAGSISNGLAQ